MHRPYLKKWREENCILLCFIWHTWTERICQKTKCRGLEQKWLYSFVLNHQILLSFSPKKPFCIFPKHPSLSKESHNIFYSQQTTLLLIAEKMRPSFETPLKFFFFSFPPLNFPWEERITYALDYTFLHLFGKLII